MSRSRSALPCALLTLAALAAARPSAATAQAGGIEAPMAAVDDPLSLPRPTLAAHHTTAAITLDGVLDEDAWLEADSTDGVFWATIPRQGVHSRERTVVRILYDDETIYIGAVLFDARPDQLFSAGLEQDFRTENSDIFGVALDTYFDRQNAFMFAINPAGALFDAQAFNDQAYVNREWEGVVDVATSIQPYGWVVELALPMTTLRFDASKPEQTWGINFSRRIRRYSEDSMWAPLSRQYRLYKMSLAGTLTGLTNLKQGRNLWVKPFTSVGRAQGLNVTGTDTNLDGGLDLKWGVTPQLTLDVTALTDFSQVEVDEQQVNLTRFPLFFPEKRDFFLENEGIFSFQDAQVRNYRLGSSPRDFKLFHSRRIGLSPGREPLPIAGGARLTGRIGNFDVGLLNMQTRTDTLAPAENFSVLRLRRNLFTSSDIGFMFVNRQQTAAGSDDYNRAFGVDGNFRFGSTLVNSYFAFTDDPDATGQNTAGKVEVAWRNPLWDLSAFGKTVGDGFEPDLGFVARRGFRQGFVTMGAHPQPDLPNVAELNPYVDVSVYTDLDGELETREVTPGLQIHFLDSSTLTVEHVRQYERLADATAIAGATVPAGEYDFGLTSLTYRSDGGRPVAGSLTMTKGDFYDGDRTSVGGTITLRPTFRWFIEGSYQRNRLTLGGQEVDADLYGGRLGYSRNTRTFLNAFVQYNTSADELVTNVRLNIIHAPLSDLFLVYSERRNLDPAPGDPRLINRLLTLKVTRLFAF
ncbi:MAG: DUF5916 domain-containing protein [Gemmatimonadota bacterium]